ncbi:hypothetical protein [Deinococcus navajonensis]|uniref:Uncharacterized protein n=1 Tax=Deinococcus navajonensis TaxID=309884 RepID=A0ABV8XGK8_9DEIO
MNHTRTWSDVYGSACASFEGRAGGHRWLVATPSELATNLAAALGLLDGKGQVDLLVHDGLTPLMAATRALDPRGVVVVAPQPLAGGPAVQVEPHTVESPGGLNYCEGGEFPAWHGWAPADRSMTTEAECPAASAIASLGYPVLVTAPGQVRQALEAWMAATPHGR